MMFTFDLVSEPWIPVLLDDGTTRELGLRDVLEQAPRIREIAHDSPLFVASIHPLLTAILHRVLEGTSTRGRKAAWRQLWDQKCFDSAAIETYFARWSDRFDLFHPEHPFYQVAGLSTSKPKELGSLPLTESEKSIFRLDSELWFRSSPATAAQVLVTAQSFGATGKNSDAEIGDKKIGSIYSSYAILTTGLTVWLSGDNLFQTLMLGLVPHELNHADAPCWELDASQQLGALASHGTKATGQPRGICDLLTLQSRMILLVPEDVSGEARVSTAHFTQGRVIERDSQGHPYLHPMKLYENTPTGVSCLYLSESKAIWRNAHALLYGVHHSSDVGGLKFAAEISMAELIEKRHLHKLNVVGVVPKPGNAGKFLLWRHDRLPIPPALLTDENLVGFVRDANRDADLVADEMRSRFATVARVFVSGDRDGGHKPDPDNVKAIIAKFDPRRAFWPRLEAHFYQLLQALPNAPEKALGDWEAVLQSTARECLRASCDALGDSPQAITAVAQINLAWGFDLKYLRDPKAFIDAKKLREAEAKKVAKASAKAPAKTSSQAQPSLF